MKMYVCEISCVKVWSEVMKYQANMMLQFNMCFVLLYFPYANACSTTENHQRLSLLYLVISDAICRWTELLCIFLACLQLFHFHTIHQKMVLSGGIPMSHKVVDLFALNERGKKRPTRAYDQPVEWGARRLSPCETITVSGAIILCDLESTWSPLCHVSRADLP